MVVVSHGVHVTGLLTYLVVVVLVPVGTVPRANSNVHFPVGKRANPLLQLGEILGSVDSDDLAVLHMDAVLELVLGVLAGLGPGVVQVLHEARIALASLGLAHLLYNEVAACADDYRNIEEVIAAKAVLGDLGLLALGLGSATGTE